MCGTTSCVSCLRHNCVYSQNYDILILKNNFTRSALSFAQERLWFIDKYEVGTNAYNIPMIFKLSAEARLDILEQSLNNIISRHEILRTLIKEDENGSFFEWKLSDS